tara:strand:- start:55 stop:450 length:396 start_codon:yes stop_codon:yes gene_type:complete
MINQEVKLNEQTMMQFIELLQKELIANPGNDMMQSLAFVSRQLQELEEFGIVEMKKYEFACEIELHPTIQYIDANTSEEAMELMQQIVADESFIHDLDPNDFKVVSADQINLTDEYRKYVNKHKIKLEEIS